jgi:hypothetical protein
MTKEEMIKAMADLIRYYNIDKAREIEEEFGEVFINITIEIIRPDNVLIHKNPSLVKIINKNKKQTNWNKYKR